MPVLFLSMAEVFGTSRMFLRSELLTNSAAAGYEHLIVTWLVRSGDQICISKRDYKCALTGGIDEPCSS